MKVFNFDNEGFLNVQCEWIATKEYFIFCYGQKLSCRCDNCWSQLYWWWI